MPADAERGPNPPSMPEPGGRYAVLDWARLAAPQADGYDTEAICRLAGGSGRPEVAGTEMPVWFAVSPVYRPRADFQRDFQDFLPADAERPSLPLAVTLLDCWPIGARQARRLEIRVVHAGLEAGLGGSGLAGRWRPPPPIPTPMTSARCGLP